MRIVLGSNQLTSINGADTYLLTVAEQLESLGHDVTLLGLDVGEMAAFARKRGLSVAAGEDGLPDSCDAMVTNDTVIAQTLAHHYPNAPHVFVAHSEDFAFCSPPLFEGVISAVVVLNDRVARRLDALPLEAEVVRLRQPVDRTRFSDRGPIRPTPRRVLLLGNYLTGEQRDLLMGAWEDPALEWVQVGAHGTSATPEPEFAIAEADIVVGHGRAVLEAMSCGRAAYVFDHSGGDGWVTPGRYAAMEADGFGGHAFQAMSDEDRLRRDLALYRPRMGLENRTLAEFHHRADHHARELIGLLGRLPARLPDDNVPLRETARLAKLEWRAVGRAHQLSLENDVLRRRVHELEEENARLHGPGVEPAVDELAGFRRTRRYRVMQMLLRPLDAARRPRRGRSGRAIP